MRRMWWGLKARWKGIVQRGRVDRDMDDEIAFHIEMEIEKNLRAGMSPAEARRAAHRAFGGVEQHREQLRADREAWIVEPLFRELRFAVRSALRTPGFSLVAIATIALGIGATTSVYAIADALFFNPLPVPESDRLVSFVEDRRGRTSTGLEGMRLSYDRYEAYVEGGASVFSGMATHVLEDVALRLADGTYPVTATLTSGNYFSVLLVQPAEGRAYSDVNAPELVISDALRRRYFPGTDPVGELVHVDGHAYTIVGVAPPEFRGSIPIRGSDLWIPYQAARSADGAPWYEVWGGLIGRLRPEADLEAAEAVIQTLAVTIPPDNENTEVFGARVYRVTGLPRLDDIAPVAAFIGMLLAMAGVLLMIASANLASMLLARAITRRRELAIRLAVGAGSRRLVRQLLAESMVLFSLGGLLGVGLAYVLTGSMETIPLPPQVGFNLSLRPDGSVLAFAMAVTIVTGLIFSLTPAFQAAKTDLVPALRDGGRGGASRASAIRNLFVTGQVAMVALLLVVATLLGRSFQKGMNADLGFDEDGVWVSTTDLSLEGHDEASGRLFYDELLRRTRGLPGVESASLAQIIALNGDSETTRISGAPVPAGESPQTPVSTNIVAPGYFAVMGIPIVDGREFGDGDVVGSPDVAVVNQTLANELWPGQSAVGQVIYRGERTIEVVGVVPDTKYQFVMESPMNFAFLPFGQTYRGQMTLHYKAPTDGARVQESVREIVRQLEPNLAIDAESPISQVVDFSLFAHRFAAYLIGAFGISGLLLAVLGVYGVLSFQVAQRTRELGIRRALGAKSSRVVWGVVRSGLVLAGLGCVIGLLLGGGVAQLLRSVLIGLEPLDPVTFGLVPLLLVGVALVASLVPGIRAISIAAVDALREE